jgi:hypothetical protein
MRTSFFIGFGDELVKLSAEIYSKVVDKSPPSPKIPSSPKIPLSEFKKQQDFRRAESLKFPDKNPLSSQNKRSTADSILKSLPKNERDLKADAAAKKQKSVDMQKSHTDAKSYMKSNPQIFHGIKLNSDTGRASYNAEKLHKQTMDSKMSAKDIVDKYALGTDKKRSGKKESFRSRESTPPWRPKAVSSDSGKSYMPNVSGDHSRWQNMEQDRSSKAAPGSAAAHARQQATASTKQNPSWRPIW